MTEALMIKQLNYRRNQKQLLTDVNLTLPQGQIVGLLGANGAGKTTLMRLIAGSAVNFRGSIQVGDAGDAVARKAQVSFSGMIDGFNPNWRVGQVAETLAELLADFRGEDFYQLCDLLGLDQKQRIKRLSKGNQRKLRLAVTLSRRAQLYLLDEPFDGIDVMTRKAMLNSILKWAPELATLVISDHHVTDIEQLLDQVVVIKARTIAAQAQADDIRAQGQSVEQYFESFFGGDLDD
ncbi:ATP-binding cassette domain-containing protein [Lacticaseibacillus baoqingensis]|uniref:ATP-binding cassette domain-containing protein n=1 Tax=Lacticaseibacillus baoqingensis TaxID=2486013 RepID=A0ABW4E9R0_9LACO|nr:ABC transporter ATP-binding protein [Lacticaseibacillus baoqingensis]